MNGDVYAPDITLDRSSPVPLYFQIAEPIAAAINDHTLATGTRIEDELSMAKRLRVSRPTARQALQRLVDQGLVVRQRGVGTRVAPTLIHRPMELTSLHSDLVRAGHQATTQLLDHTEREATEQDAEALGCAVGAPVTEVRRLRLADGEPIAVMRNVIPGNIAPTALELEEGGLYDALRSRNIQLHSARQSIGARSATADEAALLGVKRGAPLLTMRRVTALASGEVVEFGDHVYRADLYSFDSTVFTS